MIGEREREPFRSLEDFRRRSRFDRRQVRQLATVGAFREYATTRREAIWEVEMPELEQGDLFSDQAETAPGSSCLLPEMGYGERLQADFSGMGMTAGRHPMAMVRPLLPSRFLSSAQLPGCGNGQTVSTAGAVICRQRPGTAKGVVFITLEDEMGLSNSIVHADRFEEYRLMITTESFLIIHGTIQKADDTTHVIAESIEPLRTADSLPAAASHDFH